MVITLIFGSPNVPFAVIRVRSLRVLSFRIMIAIMELPAGLVGFDLMVIAVLAVRCFSSPNTPRRKLPHEPVETNEIVPTPQLSRLLNWLHGLFADLVLFVTCRRSAIPVKSREVSMPAPVRSRYIGHCP